MKKSDLLGVGCVGIRCDGTPDVPPTSPRPPRRFPKISIFCRIFFETSEELWGVHWASIHLPRHHRRLPTKCFFFGCIGRALGSPLGIDKPPQTSPEASREIFFFEFLTHTPCEMEPKSSVSEKVPKSSHRKRFTASRLCWANHRAISLGSVKSQLIWLCVSRV